MKKVISLMCTLILAFITVFLTSTGPPGAKEFVKIFENNFQKQTSAAAADFGDTAFRDRAGAEIQYENSSGRVNETLNTATKSECYQSPPLELFNGFDNPPRGKI